MSRDDVKEHIEDQLRDPDAGQTSQQHGSEDGGTAEVALCTLVCTECGSENGREPRPTNCPNISQECNECNDFVPHEVVPDSKTAEVETDSEATNV